MDISRLYKGEDIDIGTANDELEITYFDGTNQVVVYISHPNDIELLMKACEDIYAKIYADEANYG